MNLEIKESKPYRPKDVHIITIQIPNLEEPSKDFISSFLVSLGTFCLQFEHAII